MPRATSGQTSPSTRDHFSSTSARGIVPERKLRVAGHVRPIGMAVRGKMQPLRIGVAEAREFRAQIERHARHACIQYCAIGIIATLDMAH